MRALGRMGMIPGRGWELQGAFLPPSLPSSSFSLCHPQTCSQSCSSFLGGFAEKTRLVQAQERGRFGMEVLQGEQGSLGGGNLGFPQDLGGAERRWEVPHGRCAAQADTCTGDS